MPTDENKPDVQQSDTQSATPASPKDDWKMLYETKAEELRSAQDTLNGLKGHATKVTKERDALKAEIEKLSEQLAGLQIQGEGFVSERETLVKTHQQTQAELDRLRRERETEKLIRKEYPALLDFYDEGLLLGIENLAGEELSGFLGKWQEKIGTAATRAGEDYRKGSAPPPPASNSQAPANVETAKQAMIAAERAHGIRSQEYSQAYSAYLAALKTPKA